MNFIQDQWNLFEEFVIPKNACAVQRQEMRRSFYAGAEVMSRLQWVIGDDKISEDECIAILEGCRDELRRFALQMQNGDA